MNCPMTLFELTCFVATCRFPLSTLYVARNGGVPMNSMVPLTPVSPALRSLKSAWPANKGADRYSPFVRKTVHLDFGLGHRYGFDDACGGFIDET